MELDIYLQRLQHHVGCLYWSTVAGALAAPLCSCAPRIGYLSMLFNTHVGKILNSLVLSALYCPKQVMDCFRTGVAHRRSARDL